MPQSKVDRQERLDSRVDVTSKGRGSNQSLNLVLPKDDPSELLGDHGQEVLEQNPWQNRQHGTNDTAQATQVTSNKHLDNGHFHNAIINAPSKLTKAKNHFRHGVARSFHQLQALDL